MIEVVIPAHNAAAFLRETLESVAAQTLPPARVTVVNDRSTDATQEVAEQAARDLAPRIAIRVIPSAGPPGPSGARNTAIRAADAPFIALLDADDLFTPVHHARMAALFAAAPDAVLAFGDAVLFRGGATLAPGYFARSGLAGLPAEEIAAGCLTLGDRMLAEVLRTGVFCTSACAVRREAALAAGLFDETMMFSEDQDLFIRLALRGRFVFTRDVVTRKREHDANLSQARNSLRFARASAEAVARLAAGGVALSAAQREAVARALRPAIGSYLYEASRAGPPSYWRAARLAAASGHAAVALRPRNLLRAAFSRLL